MKKSLFLLIFTTFFAFSHEFWLEPQKFLLKVGEKIGFRAFVGESYTGEEVDFSLFETLRFTHYDASNEKIFRVNF